MSINKVGTTGSAPLDVRPPGRMQDTAAAAASLPAQSVDGARPSKPLDQVSDDLKSVVLQAQDLAEGDASGASNELLTQLFRTLVDLLAEEPPRTKLDVKA